MDSRPDSGNKTAFSHFLRSCVDATLTLFFSGAKVRPCLVNYLRSQVNSFDTCACDKSSDD